MSKPYPLPKRWYKLKPVPQQLDLIRSKARFRVVPAGRRSGKTERAKRYLVRKALLPAKFDDPRYFAGAPTRDQAKKIWWRDLKALMPREFVTDTSESELTLRLVNGAEIVVVGFDKPERFEGQPWDGGIIDEIGNIKPHAWGENIRPALSDRKAWAWLIGVPEGRNHYFDLRNKALKDDTGEWAVFSWFSSAVLPPEEIAAAREDLDEATFRQEYEASFESFQGKAYYPFRFEVHAAHRLRDRYNPSRPIIITHDFNISPGTANILQEMQLPNGEMGTAIIGEVHIPKHSNTPAVCARIIQDWGNHKGNVIVHGDPSGGAGGTAKVAGSDWDLIKDAYRRAFGHRFQLKVARGNPPERARVNAMNARLMSASGKVRMMVDPKFCSKTADDFERVVTLKGGTGQIDKKATPQNTHHTDGIGYYIHQEFPVQRRRRGKVLLGDG